MSDQQAASGDSYGTALPWQFQRLGKLLNALGTVWIIALMVLINSDVLGRLSLIHISEPTRPY